mgnify:CR=1 FL=1|tara:strand:- start:276 stop:473 length:198 start_codon:yes stop_codon:yes gene_type:complete
MKSESKLDWEELKRIAKRRANNSEDDRANNTGLIRTQDVIESAVSKAFAAAKRARESVLQEIQNG